MTTPKRLPARQAIAEAGFELLSRNPGASLSEIAEHAGVGRATLHRHFASREALLIALAHQAIAEMDHAAEVACHDAPSHTDALKRCAKDLGPAFGLGLYDKQNPLHQGGPDSWGKVIYDDDGRHPDWAPSKGRFFAELGRIGMKYEEVKGMLLAMGKPKPSSMPQAELRSLIEGLGSVRGQNNMAAWRRKEAGSEAE